MFKDLKTGTTCKIAYPVKQYTISEAYTGNSMIRLYENGVIKDEHITEDYNLPGLISYIQGNGYTEAIDIQKALLEYDNAKESFKYAYKYLKEAKDKIIFGQESFLKDKKDNNNKSLLTVDEYLELFSALNIVGSCFYGDGSGEYINGVDHKNVIMNSTKEDIIKCIKIIMSMLGEEVIFLDSKEDEE